jgi:hypothetical protein
MLTLSAPLIAPEGTVAIIWVLLNEFTVAGTPPIVRLTREASEGKLFPVIVISVPTVADSGETASKLKFSDVFSASSLQPTKANKANNKATILSVVFIIIKIECLNV